MSVEQLVFQSTPGEQGCRQLPQCVLPMNWALGPPHRFWMSSFHVMEPLALRQQVRRSLKSTLDLGNDRRFDVLYARDGYRTMFWGPTSIPQEEWEDITNAVLTRRLRWDVGRQEYVCDPEN